MRFREPLLLLMLLVSLWHGPARAEVCTRSGQAGLPAFQHARWSLLDGAPADIWAMVQSRDDMLWLGTGSGLYRFDGQTFERVDQPHDRQLRANITALALAADGTLWIGYFTGGVSTLRNGVFRHYAAIGVPAPGIVQAIALDRRGRTWVATSTGLALYDGRRWVGARELGYSGERAEWVVVDAKDNVWVATGDSVVGLPSGGRRFRSTGVKTGRRAVLAEGADGQIWVSDATYGTRVLQSPLQPAAQLATVRAYSTELAQVHAKRLWRSPDNALWGTDARCGGLFRAGWNRLSDPAPRLEYFASPQGLTSDVAVPGLFDREGNVWVGTNQGLNRLRRRSILIPHFDPALDISRYDWAAGPNGALLVKDGQRVLTVDPLHARELMRLPDTARLMGEHNGVVWAVDDDGLTRATRYEQILLKLPGNSGVEHLLAFALSADGIPYVSVAGRGVYRWHDSSWQLLVDSRLATPGVMALEGGALWMSAPQGGVMRLSRDRLEQFSNAQGLQIQEVTALSVQAGQVFAVGNDGLAWREGSVFRTLPGTRLGGLSGVTGIALDRHDVLWLNTLKGVIRVSCQELTRAWEQPDTGVAYRLFDAQDGLPGVAIQSSPTNTAVGAGDRIWMATNGGVAWISQDTIQSNAHRPSSVILGIKVNGTDYPLRPVMRVPHDTHSLQIQYTSPNLSAPQRVRFRYRLEGAHNEWNESDAREALYSNLRPGAYRFVVTAANSDGLWSERPASFELTINHAPWQTRSFRILVSLVILAVAALLYWRHLHQTSERVRLRVTERYRERERIARELHDTLLQGLQGLILRLDSVGLQTQDPTMKRDLDHAVARAEEMLIESRDRVSDLRAEVPPGEDLTLALERIAEGMALESTARLTVLSNDPIPLIGTANDELYRIGREAILNAYRHANANHITVSLSYQRNKFIMVIRDDGVGIASEYLGQGQKKGHWGLAGMRERVARIGGAVEFETEHGTCVQVTAPARRVYVRRPFLRALRAYLLGLQHDRFAIRI